MYENLGSRFSPQLRLRATRLRLDINAGGRIASSMGVFEGRIISKDLTPLVQT